MIKLFFEAIGLGAILLLAYFAYSWETDMHLPKVIPDRAKEQYKIAPLTATTTEHYRVIREGRYITICYWVVVKKTGVVSFSHCYTKSEWFNGY